MHVHDEEDECFYVLDGHLLVQVGEERHDLGPGCFAWLPRQFPHTFANVSGSPVHLVGAIVPGGIEEFSACWAPTSPSCRDRRIRGGSRPSGPVTPAGPAASARRSR
ncbi:MAG: cupin domain-containing protein [Trebonia sp.]